MRKGMTTLDKKELGELAKVQRYSFPKYAESLLNLANQISQGTRPSHVGQLSELIKECPYKDYKRWATWYTQKYPYALENATERIIGKVKEMDDAMAAICKNRGLVRTWVEDVVLVRTFIGLNIQEPILMKVSKLVGKPYRNATPHEESQGIDGWIGNVSVSVKPTSWRPKEHFNVSANKIIYYKKPSGKGNITVDYSVLLEPLG